MEHEKAATDRLTEDVSNPSTVEDTGASKHDENNTEPSSASGVKASHPLRSALEKLDRPATEIRMGVTGEPESYEEVDRVWSQVCRSEAPKAHALFGHFVALLLAKLPISDARMNAINRVLDAQRAQLVRGVFFNPDSLVALLVGAVSAQNSASEVRALCGVIAWLCALASATSSWRVYRTPPVTSMLNFSIDEWASATLTTEEKLETELEAFINPVSSLACQEVLHNPPSLEWFEVRLHGPGPGCIHVINGSVPMKWLVARSLADDFWTRVRPKVERSIELQKLLNEYTSGHKGE